MAGYPWWRTFRNRLYTSIFLVFILVSILWQWNIIFFFLPVCLCIGICGEKWYGMWFHHRPNSCFRSWHPYGWLWDCSTFNAQVAHYFLFPISMIFPFMYVCMYVCMYSQIYLLLLKMILLDLLYLFEHWVQARIFYWCFLCFLCRHSISCIGKLKIDINIQLFKLMNLTRSVKV